MSKIKSTLILMFSFYNAFKMKKRTKFKEPKFDSFAFSTQSIVAIKDLLKFE